MLAMMPPMIGVVETYSPSNVLECSKAKTWGSEVDNFPYEIKVPSTYQECLGYFIVYSGVGGEEYSFVEKISAANQGSRFDELLVKINKYAEMGEGWAGPGSLPAKQDIAQNVDSFLTFLPRNIIEPKSMLSPEGEVGLYWKKRGCYAEIGFSRDGGTYFFSRGSNIEHINLDDMELNNESMLRVLSQAFQVSSDRF